MITMDLCLLDPIKYRYVGSLVHRYLPRSSDVNVETINHNDLIKVFFESDDPALLFCNEKIIFVRVREWRWLVRQLVL